MAKTKISEWSTTPASNTDIDGINIAEGCAPSGINDAIRDLMSQVRSWQSGATGDPFAGPVTGSLSGATGLPISTGVSGLGTGVATALAVNVGSAGAPVVNGGALGTPSSGTVTNLTGTASININGTVGATTPTTGAFTTLSASSTVSGTGFSSYLASPPAIGGTTAAAGSFTTLSASGNVTISGGTANGVTYLNGSKVLTSGSALVFDGTNLGIGTTPTYSIEISQAAPRIRQTATTGTNTSLVQLINTGGTASIGLDNSSGVFGAAYGLTMWHSGNYPLVFGLNSAEQMRLTSTGLGIGTSSPAAKLDVSGLVRINSSTAQQLTIGDFTTVSNNADIYLRTTGLARFLSGTGGSFTWGVSGGSEFMRLDSSGNLGIGATAGYKLTVAGTSGSAVVNLLETGVRSWGIRAGGAATNTFDIADFTAGATRLTLDSSGNLGLGVTPSAWATLRGLQNGRANLVGYVSNAEGAWLTSNAFYDGSWKYQVSSQATHYQQLSGVHSWHNAASGTAGNAITSTQAMTLDASGNLLVGATSVVGSSVSGLTLRNGGTSGNLLSAVSSTASRDHMVFYNPNGTCGSLYTTGTTFGLYNASDMRLKQNIDMADNASALIDAIQVRKFDWKVNAEHQRYGFIAQELATVFPEAVKQPENPDEMMGVDYSKLVPMLVKEIQSLRKRLADAGIA